MSSYFSSNQPVGLLLKDIVDKSGYDDTIKSNAKGILEDNFLVTVNDWKRLTAEERRTMQMKASGAVPTPLAHLLNEAAGLKCKSLSPSFQFLLLHLYFIPFF